MDKKDATMIYGGKGIARLEKSLPNSEEVDMYEKLKTKLNDCYAPRKNKHYPRYVFHNTGPIAGESTVAYAARLGREVQVCEFDNADERKLEHIIQITENQSLVQKAINRKWSLHKLLQEAH